MATRSNSSSRQAPQRKKPANSNSNRTTTRKTTTRKQPEPVNVSYFDAFRKSKFFWPLATVVIIVVGGLLDILFAWNNYDRFFLILGIELILVAIAWIVMLLLSLGSEVMSEE